MFKRPPPPPEKKATSKYISPYVALNSHFVEILYESILHKVLYYKAAATV